MNRFYKFKLPFIMTAMALLLCLLCGVATAEEPKTWYVDANLGSDTEGLGSQESPYQTIQKAIAVASDGDIIFVKAGTYAIPSTIQINKALTLRGPNHDKNPTQGGQREAEAVLDGGSTNRFLRIRASNVTIESFTITSSGKTAIWQNGADAVDGLVIRNNIFDGNSEAFATSVAAAGNPNTLNNLHFVNNLIVNNTSRSFSHYTGVMGTNFTIEGNEIRESLCGFHLGNVDGVTIANNHITLGDNYWAILLAGTTSDNVVIADNILDGQNTAGVGISVWYEKVDLGKVTVENNTIKNFKKAGINIRQNEGDVVDASQWTVTRNTIMNNDIGILHEGTGTLNAANNWWGHATGPTSERNPGGQGDAVEGDVNFLPWYVDEAMTQLSTTEIDCVDSGDTELEFVNSGVTMEIETDEKEGYVSVTRYSYDDRSAPEGMIPAGIYLRIERSDNLAGAPVRMEISYDPDELTEGVAEDDLRLYRYNPEKEQWELITSQGIDKDKKILWAKLDEFSEFGIFAAAPEEPVVEEPEEEEPGGDTPRTSGGLLYSFLLGLFLVLAGFLLIRKEGVQGR
ncbi:MAG TPA: right-handed parallel beta-helix repeat-containing protein [Bacillota bacterium]|nr:right-handed parallel beta-helix repeat-containing protein [Bacillota bacterium]